MKKTTQSQISKMSGISPGFLSDILNKGKRPSWSTAKRLAAATNTDPVLWLEGSPNEIKKALSQESDTLMKN
jgi:transcriptional regulator with XRE-family HTH domain